MVSKSITLTSSMRSNLSSLKTIASQMDKTQKILSSGKKVNSAIDNASSYYQARALTNRANDLSSLLDSMSQGIQTIQAAITGVESATSLIEQMQSVVAQASTIAADSVYQTNVVIEIPEGAKKISSGMSTDEIQNILSQGGTVVLKDNITIDKTLVLDGNVELIGNGKTISYAGSSKGDSAIKVSSEAKISYLNISYSNSAPQGAAVTIDGGKAEIDNLTIDATGYRVYGIQVLNKGELTLDNTDNIRLNGEYSQKLVNGNPDLWDGEYNTDMIIDQIGGNAPAADGCKNYIPSLELADDENFGQGTWYLPAEGELMDLYGTDYDAVTGVYNSMTGANGKVRDEVNKSLNALKNDCGVDAEALKSGWYWSSSEYNHKHS